MAAVWTSFGIYALWYLTSAKDYAPLTVREAEFLWKLHRQFDQCKAKTWQRIMYNGRIVGFRCECGYQYIQKRPIAVNSPPIQVCPIN